MLGTVVADNERHPTAGPGDVADQLSEDVSEFWGHDDESLPVVFGWGDMQQRDSFTGVRQRVGDKGTVGELEKFFAAHTGVTEYFDDRPAHERLVVFQRDVAAPPGGVADVDDPWPAELDAPFGAAIVNDELLAVVLERHARLEGRRTIK